MKLDDEGGDKEVEDGGVVDLDLVGETAAAGAATGSEPDSEADSAEKASLTEELLKPQRKLKDVCIKLMKVKK